LRTKVKVCGITNLEDALLASEAGVDALGFNFHPQSPRYLKPAAAAEIIRRLPPFQVCVGVFVNSGDPENVDRTARQAGVRIVQLHGDESAGYAQFLSANWSVIKAFRIGAMCDIAEIRAFPADAVLLDTADSRLYGGTGRTFDWEICRKLNLNRPMILAGGLNAGNVACAIRMIRPYAVDVCSGIENMPGKKDPLKLSEFIEEVKDANQ
jgi:phosphoribosylanthranilate isomerase